MTSSAAGTDGGSSTRVLAERDGQVWPGFDQDVISELGIERALLTLTKADGPFPAGPIIWKEGDRPGT